MNTIAATTPDAAPSAGESSVDGRRSPMPFMRLLRVQLRAWGGQRGIVWITAVALMVGLGAIVFGPGVPDKPDPTATDVETGVLAASIGFLLLWMAIGVLAGAAPFRSGWLGMILSVAPRRLRWLAASYVSIIAWAVAGTVMFGALGWAAVTALLVNNGDDPSAGTGVLTALPAIGIKILLDTTVGFALGSAVRGVAVPLMAGYVGAGMIPVLAGPSHGFSRLADLNAATDAVAGTRVPSSGIGPVIAALVLWMVLPAAIAATRLRRSAVR
jgi:hypothetical protein